MESKGVLHVWIIRKESNQNVFMFRGRMRTGTLGALILRAHLESEPIVYTFYADKLNVCEAQGIKNRWLLRSNTHF